MQHSMKRVQWSFKNCHGYPAVSKNCSIIVAFKGLNHASFNRKSAVIEGLELEHPLHQIPKSWSSKGIFSKASLETYVFSSFTWDLPKQQQQQTQTEDRLGNLGERLGTFDPAHGGCTVFSSSSFYQGVWPTNPGRKQRRNQETIVEDNIGRVHHFCVSQLDKKLKEDFRVYHCLYFVHRWYVCVCSTYHHVLKWYVT